MMHTIFVRLLKDDKKEARLAETIESHNAGRSSAHLFLTDPASFANIPGSPFAYWVSEYCRQLFKSLHSLEGEGREVRVGDHPGDGFRFLRLFWEVPIPSTQDWRSYQKGGDFSPFYYDIHLLADWDANRQTYRGFSGRPGRPNERPSNYQFFFRPGITWPRRSQRGLSVRILPSGCVFADKGPVVFGDTQQLLALLGLLNSAAFKGLLALQMAFGSFETGAMQRTVIPKLNGAERKHLAAMAQQAFEVKKTIDSSKEISHAFVLPALLQCTGDSLNERISEWTRRMGEYYDQLREHQHQLDELSFQLYGITGNDRRSIEEMTGASPNCDAEDVPADEQDDDVDASSAVLDKPFELVSQMVSYAVGATFGRWNVRLLKEQQKDMKQDIFAELPVCPPCMLRGTDGLPATNSPPGYPVRIQWDGILVDDSEHSDDVVGRVRNVFEVIWSDRAELIEKEACEFLSVKEIREYFRKPGNGGFWGDHIPRYSKSRRSAPIYWLLQSSKRNYGFWLYYHRLDKDLLFKALVNYVEPKIRLETNRMETLRRQKPSADTSNKDEKRLAKELERLDDFLSELRDFEDKLRRVANLHLEPDLNDGVVLNIAPLRELVPWKEAEKYWGELLAGKYEWSSIGKQLRQRGLVK